ncbi:hypothetical protein PSD17_06800 [Pseudonocardia sp. D17]|nr:hypothetical protein PSD17_06800 [Pseudonocardia sp. D17]
MRARALAPRWEVLSEPAIANLPPEGRRSEDKRVGRAALADRPYGHAPRERTLVGAQRTGASCWRGEADCRPRSPRRATSDWSGPASAGPAGSPARPIGLADLHYGLRDW